MKKRMLVTIFVGTILLMNMGYSNRVIAATNVNAQIRIPPPPPFLIPAPPPVVVIPRTYVYAVPEIEVDILFYHGHWYRPHEGRWYRSRSYNGPWAYLPPRSVPRPLIELPPDHHRIPPGYRRIPHRDLKNNWSGWERRRHWDRDREWREGWRRGPEGREPHHMEKGEHRPDRGPGRGRHGD
jgi:hypothetical protein